MAFDPLHQSLLSRSVPNHFLRAPYGKTKLSSFPSDTRARAGVRKEEVVFALAVKGLITAMLDIPPVALNLGNPKSLSIMEWRAMREPEACLARHEKTWTNVCVGK